MPHNKRFGKKQSGMLKPSRKWRNAVKRVISSSQETKVKGTVVSEFSISSAAAAVIQDDLSLVLQGDDDRQRIGDDIKAFGLMVKYMLINNSTNPSYTRVILTQCDKDEFDAITDLLLVDPDNEPTAPAAGNLLDINAPLNKRAIKRVLYDRVHKMNATDGGQGNITVRVQKLFKFNHKVRFTTGSSSDSEEHNLRLWFMCRGANADAETVIAECHLDTRYYYKDS